MTMTATMGVIMKAMTIAATMKTMITRRMTDTPMNTAMATTAMTTGMMMTTRTAMEEAEDREDRPQEGEAPTEERNGLR